MLQKTRFSPTFIILVVLLCVPAAIASLISFAARADDACVKKQLQNKTQTVKNQDIELCE